MKNLFAHLPSKLPRELVEILALGESVRIERIVSLGHASPTGFWYDQDEAEWVLLLQGGARIEFDDGELELHPGDCLSIPAHQRHRVTWTTPDQPTVWLAVHYRPDDDGGRRNAVSSHTARDEASYICDACGEEIVVPLDLSQGSSQEYVEDCPVCCRPNLIHVEIDDDGHAQIWAEPS